MVTHIKVGRRRIINRRQLDAFLANAEDAAA
jgi:hypothetical protein